MSQDFASALTNLPVIIQGALGSALFAVIVWLGQKLFTFAASRATRFTRLRRIDYLTDEIAKLHFVKGKDFALKGAFLTLLVFRSLRSFVKAFIWLSLGLLGGALNPIFGTVGYLGAMYYFFSALNTLRAPEQADDVAAKLGELSAERKALKAEA